MASITTAKVASKVEKPLKHKRRFCKVVGCTRIVKSQGVCQRHGAKSTKCKIEGCAKQAQGSYNGMCKAHAREMKAGLLDDGSSTAFVGMQESVSETALEQQNMALAQYDLACNDCWYHDPDGAVSDGGTSETTLEDLAMSILQHESSHQQACVLFTDASIDTSYTTTSSGTTTIRSEAKQKALTMPVLPSPPLQILRALREPFLLHRREMSDNLFFAKTSREIREPRIILDYYDHGSATTPRQTVSL